MCIQVVQHVVGAAAEGAVDNLFLALQLLDLEDRGLRDLVLQQDRSTSVTVSNKEKALMSVYPQLALWLPDLGCGGNLGASEGDTENAL